MDDSPSSYRDVLLVDDDAATRRLFEHVLARVGLSIVTAADGVEALGILATQRVDAIVLDLMMPRMSGFEVLENFATERAELLRRTIVLSAASLQWVTKASEYPVFAVLRKPVDLDALVEAVLDCLVQDADGARKPARPAIAPAASIRAAG
jgi:CheY-like chemotaxis protein